MFKTGQAKPNKVIRYKSGHRLPEKRALFSITVIFAAGVCSSFANNVDSRDPATSSLYLFFNAAGKNFLDVIHTCKIITLDGVTAFCCVVYLAAGFDGGYIFFSGWGEPGGREGNG